MDAMIRCTKYLLITALVFLQITNSFVSKAQKLFFTSTIVNRVAVNEKYTYSVAVKDASQKKNTILLQQSAFMAIFRYKK